MRQRLLVATTILLLLPALLPAMPEVDDTVTIEESESRDARFRVRRVLGGIAHPWSIAFLDDESYLVTERPGALYLVSRGEVSRIEGLPDIAANGQGGLLDLLVDPDFQDNQLIYFTYSASGSEGLGTRLMRARLEGTTLTDEELLFTMEEGGSGGRHFGSRIVMDSDGYIYMSIGDRGERDRAQDPADHAGKILRLTSDGQVPSNNPFVEQEDALPEIFTLGNRNAQGMSVHPETGQVWAHEHGPRGGDEINIIESGANYGWPEVSYGREYAGGRISRSPTAPEFRDPLLHWTPSIAPSGMTFYTGEVFPGWEGDIFVGALVGRHLRRVELDGSRVTDQEVLLADELGRIRDVEVGPDGYLYILIDDSRGAIFRLEPVE
ncbi:MAG: PQQ-dependent sugar dehydrogenase [Spirochaetaceae bacterium]